MLTEMVDANRDGHRWGVRTSVITDTG